jgi:hypothetical protein
VIADNYVLFVCGSSRNSDRFREHFEKVFILRIDDVTMRRRLEARTEEDWPLGQDAVEAMLELNRREEWHEGSIDVDATQPLSVVVDEILRLSQVNGF